MSRLRVEVLLVDADDGRGWLAIDMKSPLFARADTAEEAARQLVKQLVAPLDAGKEET